MPVVPLVKRDECWGYYCSSSTWVWGRWILFVLFILAILMVVLAAIRINKRRSQEGREPIRGTAWITPPSYIQSQHQNNTQQPYVPPYTEETNDNDAGFYDQQGVFHPNLKAQEAYNFRQSSVVGPNGQSTHLSTLVPDNTGITAPNQAYQPTGQSQFTGDDHELNFNRDFSRYYNTANTNTTTTTNNDNQGVASSSSPRPNNTTTNNTGNTVDVELEQFSRPDGPPPAHLKNGK